MDNDLFNSPGDDLSLFDDKPDVVIIDPNKNYLEELVGEGKKFKTPEDLAKGKAESDAFIANLLRETKELRNELTKAKTVDDLFARLSERDPPANQPAPNNTSVQEQPTSGGNVSFEEIAKKLKDEFRREEELKKRQSNIAEVSAKLNETLGAGAKAHLTTKAAELGIPLSELQEIAAKSPALFYTAVGLDKVRKEPFAAPPSSKANTQGLQAINAGGERTQSYYQKLRATDKARYNSQEVQMQMLKDAKRLGEAFFDT